MLKYIIDLLKKAKDQNDIQTRLYILFGKNKKSNFVKVNVPEKYISVIEVAALYGISDGVQLLKILENHTRR